MKIALSYRVDLYPEMENLSKRQMGRVPLVPVETYARSVEHYLREAGHEVSNVFEDTSADLRGYDAYIELDNGRDGKGELGFARRDLSRVVCPTAVWFVDSHGQPRLHRELAPRYKHVFFAVYARRDLFAGHRSAHWCPNATDLRFFYPGSAAPTFDFGFFGSKNGLDRADALVQICQRRGWTADVRQIGGTGNKHRWPRTCEAMLNCATLFNRGQKHDINLRIFESMATGRPLICDVDPLNGMEKLFTEGEHYLGYEAYTFKGLEERMLYAKENPEKCRAIADKARALVVSKHLVKHRVAQMLEVLGA